VPENAVEQPVKSSVTLLAKKPNHLFSKDILLTSRGTALYFEAPVC
jgi:hypothetical protein